MRSALAWAALVLGGCAGTSPKVAPHLAPGEARTRAERFFAERWASIETVHAGLEIAWSSPELAEPASCRGSLVMRAPDQIRLRGTSSAFFTIFDLVATSDVVRVDFPTEKLLVRGARDDPAWTDLLVAPDLLWIALLGAPEVERMPSVEVREKEGALVATSGGLIIDLDPATGLPRSAVETGERETTLAWDDWREEDGIAWPGRVVIERAASGEKLEVLFGRVRLGRPVRSEFFEEEPEDPRDILDPVEGVKRWRTAMEEGTRVRK